MLDPVYLGFDFGYKRIGVSVGQRLTCRASPLPTLRAERGVPQWEKVDALMKSWRPAALVVGLPTCIDGAELYTTEAARLFADELHVRFNCPVHLTDERLSTVEARSQLFAIGGYRKLKATEVDSMAACIILEQWLHESN